MNTRLLVASLLALFSLSTPEIALANEECENGVCEVVFEYTGTGQQWSIPEGITSFEFEIYGASGGRGGLGGSVKGSLSQLPSTVWIFVGGAGAEGKTAAGGFNGGGQAGGNRGNEGSGGGASDIRLSQALSDRIAVAGGGGGAGGYKGAAGGSGGGLIGGSGATGQGGGGAGGSQTQGGSGGGSLGGTQPSSGTFGNGGFGGVSWNAGGGGGGGGWYGGGGGGADDDTCCSDGGGGGGGSSYASSTYTSNITHHQGVRSGNGYVVIRYLLPVEVLSLSAEQTSSTSAELVITADRNIENLTFSDFEISGAGCTFVSISESATTARAVLNSCSDGITTFTLLANSLGPSGQGPAEPVSTQLVFDGVGPVFSWLTVSPVYSTSPIVISFSVSDNLELTTESFSVASCSTRVEFSSLELTSCSQGVIRVEVVPGVLIDSWGNLGTQNKEFVEFFYDSLGPQIEFEPITHSGEVVFTYSTILRFSESITFSLPSVIFTSDVTCESSDEVRADGWYFWANCGYAQLSWEIIADKVFDLNGNPALFELGSVSYKLSEPISVATEPSPPSSAEREESPPSASGDSSGEPAQIVDSPDAEQQGSAFQEEETESPEAEVGSPEIVEPDVVEELEPVVVDEMATEPNAPKLTKEAASRVTPLVVPSTVETISETARVFENRVEVGLEEPILVIDSSQETESTQFPTLLLFVIAGGLLILGLGLLRITGK